MHAGSSHPAGPFVGAATVPGDKSVSIRALILGLLSAGETVIHGLLEGEDVLAVAGAIEALGASLARDDEGVWHVWGVGLGGLAQPASPLDLGNSGTGARLLMGVVASHDISATFEGDASLSARPMGRVTEPLARFGARIVAAGGGRLPLTIVGAANPAPHEFGLEVPSAQVKSAILLAGLNTPGTTTVVEHWPTRDHTERMLQAFGADLRVEGLADGGRRISLVGQPELTPGRVVVPADISSAAFPMIAAGIVPGSEIRLDRVGMNPTRAGLLRVLQDMGADITLENETSGPGEPLADIVVRGGGLQGVTPDPALAPTLIDEFPILFVAAACASGRSEFRGLEELRIKESDRIHLMAEGLAACGVGVEELDDGLIVEGCGGPPPGGAAVVSGLDHRIAMSFLVLGAAARAAVRVDDISPIATSFPGFFDLMNALGANMREENGA